MLNQISISGIGLFKDWQLVQIVLCHDNLSCPRHFSILIRTFRLQTLNYHAWKKGAFVGRTRVR